MNSRFITTFKKVVSRQLSVVGCSSAGALGDLALPPGNRLEKLHGDREGQHSIRINDQYRVCFHWRESNAYDVEIADYH